ncbi:MAG: hypothetical protein N2315_01530 [Thermanaerothrix sp.]|nr:hypothetical protein [Thermanaerothrix sp.]
MDTHRNLKGIGALGDYESVLPFQAIGLDAVVVSPDADDEEVRNAVHRFRTGGFAILFVTERVYASHREFLDEINDTEDLTVVPIPGIGGSMGLGMQSVRKCVERAVGMDIFAVQ